MKILAIEKEMPGVLGTDYQPHLEAEARKDLTALQMLAPKKNAVFIRKDHFGWSKKATKWISFSRELIFFPDQQFPELICY